MGKSLYQKIVDLHTVREFGFGQYQVLIGLHLVHEVTSPQAFSMLRERGRKLLFPNRTFATVDHIIPTHTRRRPYKDDLAEAMQEELERNVGQFNITYFPPESGRQGIVHVIAPELGLTQPGMTICCGDSHTSTHGAFGALAFGIGTTQVRDVLSTQTLAMHPLRVRRIELSGQLGTGVEAKDVILFIINRLGAKGGAGYAYEYAGEAFDRFSMEDRMTVCNMSIEGGAQCGYVNPDETTYRYLRGRAFAPRDDVWDTALRYWNSVRSDPDAAYDDVVRFNAAEIEPMVTWGITPAQSIPVGGRMPALESFPNDERDAAEEAYRYMGFQPGEPIRGTPIDVAFVGSCANGRLSDFEKIARLVEGRGFRAVKNVRALIVPGSEQVKADMVSLGYADILAEAGFEIREPGCSMCIGMNADALIGRDLCASSSTRNFKGRQGSPVGRTLLMSPVMVAAAALAGEVVDAREFFGRAVESR